MTLVTVITPSFNQGAFLQKTLDSILGQDYPHLECIVVDGGSSDNSLDIIRANAARLAWWVSEPDAGQAEAINKGLLHAHGDIVAWLNSDDYYLPGSVRSAALALQGDPGAAFVYGNVQAVDADGRTINMLRYPQVSLRDLLCFSIIGQPAVFMRRRAVEAAGGLDPRFHLLLDHQLWIRLAGIGTLRHVNETWAAARYHPGAKNLVQARLFGAEAFQILKWAESDPALAPVLLTVHDQARASAYRVDARYLLDAGKPVGALRAWFKAFFIHPGTALKRLNILGSAILELIGLGVVRRKALQQRGHRLQR
ncbi:MAG TPA: glycosyltransferase family 2 protein [Anaerolineales bacterium]|nr:glycosyltransferase family 2 protein [Anaerolineales bacterium]